MLGRYDLIQCAKEGASNALGEEGTTAVGVWATESATRAYHEAGADHMQFRCGRRHFIGGGRTTSQIQADTVCSRGASVVVSKPEGGMI